MAGRPKGLPKTGGRKKGARNKAAAAKAAEIAASGVTPLEFMLAVMRGPALLEATAAEQIAFAGLRFEAAKAAAPYVHPRLAAIEHTGKDGGPLIVRLDNLDARA